MTEEIVLKLLGLVVVVLVSATNIMKFDPLKEWKEDIKDDLEILSKIDKEDKNYRLVENSVKLSILMAYSKDHKPWYSWGYKKNRPVIMMFILLLVSAFCIVLI